VQLLALAAQFGDIEDTESLHLPAQSLQFLRGLLRVLSGAEQGYLRR
jgi:hypothetical protein